MTVRDDGSPGNDPGKAPGNPSGSGLAGLAERVGDAGGRLEVGTLPGGGYRLFAQVPLEAS